MSNKKYLWIILFLSFSFKLYPAEFVPSCMIEVCEEKDNLEYQVNGITYKKIIDDFSAKEFLEIYNFFNELGFLEGLQDGLKLTGLLGNNRYEVKYYYTSKNSTRELMKNDLKSSLTLSQRENIKDVDTLGFYSPTSKKLFFNAAEYLTINDFLNGESVQKQNLEDFRGTLAHELFHTTENTSGTDSLTWISEAISEAVGQRYASTSLQLTSQAMLLDIPFNFTENEDLPYARYPFYIWLGKEIGSAKYISYLKHFRKQEGDGLKSFQKSLKSVTSKKFSELLPRYLTLKTFNHPNAYVTLEATLDSAEKALYMPLIGSKRKAEEIKIPLSKENEKSKEFIIKRKVKALAVSPDILMAKYSNLTNKTKQELLRVVTIKIKAKKRKEDLTLVHEDKVYIKDKEEIEQRVVRILVKADNKVPLGLAKVVNVAEDLTKTKERDFKIEVGDELYEVDFPGCVSAGETIDMSIDNFREDNIAIFNAKKVYLKPSKGTFEKDTTLWTAPLGKGKMSADLIFEDVILHDNKNGKKDKDIEIKNFTTIYYGDNCGAKITLNTGDTYIYDAYNEVGMMKDSDGLMLTQKPNIYMYDSREGWCHINLESFFDLVFNQLGGMFNKGDKHKMANELHKIGAGITRYDTKTSYEMIKEAKEVRESKIVVSKDGNRSISVNDDVYEDPEVLEQKFDFYRLSKALNKMLSLKRLRKILKNRRIGKYKKELYVATSDDVYIKLSSKACRKEKGQCKSAVFGEKNGEKLHILYNKQNKISKLSIGGDSMVFDYGGFKAESIPTHSKSCFSN